MALKNITLREVQEILRAHYGRFKDCYAISFTAVVGHETQDEHKVSGVLCADEKGLDQLEINRLERNKRQYVCTFLEGNKKLNTYAVHESFIPLKEDVILIHARGTKNNYRVLSRKIDYTTNSAIINCQQISY